MVRMIEADEAHEESKKRLEALEAAPASVRAEGGGGGGGGGSPRSPRSPPPSHFWAGLQKKRNLLPRGVGFEATFGKYQIQQGGQETGGGEKI